MSAELPTAAGKQKQEAMNWACTQCGNAAMRQCGDTAHKSCDVRVQVLLRWDIGKANHKEQCSGAGGAGGPSRRAGIDGEFFERRRKANDRRNTDSYADHSAKRMKQHFSAADAFNRKSFGFVHKGVTDAAPQGAARIDGLDNLRGAELARSNRRRHARPGVRIEAFFESGRAE